MSGRTWTLILGLLVAAIGIVGGGYALLTKTSTGRTFTAPRRAAAWPRLSGKATTEAEGAAATGTGSEWCAKYPTVESWIGAELWAAMDPATQDRARATWQAWWGQFGCS